MGWKQTTLRQFADIHKVQSNPDTNQEVIGLTLFEYFTGRDPEKESLANLQSWAKANQWLNEYPKNINKWVWCGGLYRIKLNPADMSGDDFTTIAAYSAEDAIKYLPEIMAKLCTPVIGIKDYHRRAEYFRDNMTAWHAYGTAVFFYRLWTLLQKGGLQYSPKSSKKQSS